MSTFTWSNVRDDAVRRFASFPRKETEAGIVEVFEIRPKLVIEQIDRVAEDLAQGKVRSGWPILLSRLQGVGSAADVTATDASDRDTGIANAERWIRNAGIHCDRESEVWDELFGDRGILLGFHTAELETKLMTMWREQRPRGEVVEADELKRAGEWKRNAPLLAEIRNRAYGKPVKDFEFAGAIPSEEVQVPPATEVVEGEGMRR